MSCLGFVVMAILIARGINTLPMPSLADLRAAARLINEKKIFILYLGSTLFSAVSALSLLHQRVCPDPRYRFPPSNGFFFLIYGYVAWIIRRTGSS